MAESPLPSGLLPAGTEGIHPFRGWPEAQAEALVRRLQDLVEAWHGDWVSGFRPSQVQRSCDPLLRDIHLPWRSLAGLPHQGAFRWQFLSWIEGVPAKETLCRALFREKPSPGSLGAEALHAAWRDWWERLQECLFPGDLAATPPWEEPGAPLPGHLRTPLQGTLFLDLPWCEGRLRLALDPVLAGTTATPPAGRGVPPSFGALNSLSIPVRVDLDPLPLNLGSLLSLAPGDVLCTTHPLDRPLTLAAGTRKLCEAYLGRQGERRAVELQHNATPV